METKLETEMEVKTYVPSSERSNALVKDVVAFLFKHLEQYGDPAKHIKDAINYSLSSDGGKGGFLSVCTMDGEIAGAVVVNKTGMKGYIPENILVYIAVDSAMRGKGVGKALMKAALQSAEGAVALHVESDNPAKKLYEKLGFTNKYLEMRYQPG